jgi:hypothetical protein
MNDTRRPSRDPQEEEGESRFIDYGLEGFRLVDREPEAKAKRRAERLARLDSYARREPDAEAGHDADADPEAGG